MGTGEGRGVSGIELARGETLALGSAGRKDERIIGEGRSGLVSVNVGGVGERVLQQKQ